MPLGVIKKCCYGKSRTHSFNVEWCWTWFFVFLNLTLNMNRICSCETSNDRTMEHENCVLKKSSNWVETVYDVLSYAISFTLTFQIVHIVWLNDDSVRGFVLYHMKMLRTWKYVLFIQYTHSTYYLHIGTQIKLKTMAFIS